MFSILLIISFARFFDFPLNFIFLIDFHPWILSIILSSLVIVILGALDDSLQLGVTVRLISQLIASLIVIGSGLQIVDIGEYSILEAINLENFGILLIFWRFLIFFGSRIPRVRRETGRKPNTHLPAA